MSDLGNIRNLSLDKLIATIGGTDYAVTGFTLRMALNRPGSCEVVLAQGDSVRGSRRAAASGGTLDSSSFDAFTKVIVKLYMNGQKTPLVMFRGIVASVTRIAAKNVAGSYAGTVVNCVAPQTLMGAYSMSGYRYWSSAVEGRGKLMARENTDQALLKRLGKSPLSTLYANTEREIDFATDWAEYIPTTTGILVEYFSGKRFTANSVEVHFDNRGRKITASPVLGEASFLPDVHHIKNIINGISRNDPFTVVRSMYTRQLFMNLVPMPCGKMDAIPAFPWSTETVGVLRRADVLQLRDSTSLSPAVSNVDSVWVPIMFEQDGKSAFSGGFGMYPTDEDTPNTGTSKIVHVPAWLSPYMDAWPSQGKEESAKGSNKTSKPTKDKIDKNNQDYDTIAGALAKAFFAQIKNGGVALEVTVPWYRLEFFDSLGYLMEIEQPIFDRQEDRENLFGFLAGAALKVQSTPGGSKASLQVTFTHVRGAEEQDRYAIEEHPLFTISGGPASDIQSFLSSPRRTFNRAQQITLEGGDYESYLDEAIAEARNKK